ncbi:AfsR family transcriptional regulator [Actinomadura barringtoniae]|uniref:AfsR family transcriptional regulator n=1 Tax=Actinomadura barringtoniae TaxID=1427535 RepID=A0A939PDF1_9ACTN|nr:BTAD domain-containing putative transcriptional regulator [Actinomadura barringtoniae]MBO2447214.1 AfsR family transcriptional regulator [Actinomadura barringtoniae]
MSAEGIRFQILGRPAITAGGIPVAPPRSPVLQGLFGAFLLAGGEPLTTERLTRLVWVDRAGKTSRASVHVGVSRLRKWLVELGVDEVPGAAGLSIDYADGYLLRGLGDNVDLCRFRDLAVKAHALADPDARCRALAEALELRRGPILAGTAYLDRSDQLVRAAEQDIRTAVMDLADSALHTGTPGDAIVAVTGLADELPFDEPLHAALIDLLAASDRPAEALQAYRRLRDRIENELGVEPSGQVQESHLRVLAADQPLAADLESGAETRAPQVPVPAQLPPDIPDFTGRVDEIAFLLESLAGDGLAGPDGARRTQAPAVAAVPGMGGIGKSTLAVHVAHLLKNSFPDGQLYADLHGDSEAPADPAEVLDRFLRTLGTSGSGVPATLEERTALFRSRLAGRRILVLLDNAAAEDQVRPLLPGTPDAAVLITSRTLLTGLEGATLLNLGVLPPAHAVALLSRVIGERRVAAEPTSAMEIVRLCGHIPLAVRIAAARLLGRPHWTLAFLADMLRQERRRLDELAVGDMEVRAGFAMSYRLLPEPTRRAFRSIGLLEAPDFASWAVMALLDVSLAEAQRHLELLIDAHLVNVVGIDGTGQLRYRVHDLIRLYARERSEEEDDPADTSAALERALGAWLWLAEQAADRVPGPCYAAMHGKAPRWTFAQPVAGRLLGDSVRWFTAERAALLAAVHQACELRLDELAWDLAASLEKYFDIRGMYDDWRFAHESALRLCQETGNQRGEAVLMRGLMEVTTWASPSCSGAAMDSMRESGEELLRHFTELGDRCGMADALVAITWGLVAQGAQSEALTSAERALHLSETAAYPAGEARALHVMAIAYGEENVDRALPCLERALPLARTLGNPRFVATVLQFLGAGHALSGHVDTGRDLLNTSIAMARELDDRYLETFSLIYLAKLLAALGDGQAMPTAELALAYSEAGNFQHHLAESLAVLGELHLAAGDHVRAIALLERSVRTWRTRGWLPFLAKTLRTLGEAHAAAGDEAAAQRAWREAGEVYPQADEYCR